MFLCSSLPLSDCAGVFDVGMFEFGLPHGEGSITLTNSETYTGEFDHGHMHGTGTLTLAGGAGFYKGKFSRGQKHGRGLLLTKNQLIVSLYDGEWRFNQKHGEGKWIVRKLLVPIEYEDLTVELFADGQHLEVGSGKSLAFQGITSCYVTNYCALSGLWFNGPHSLSVDFGIRLYLALPSPPHLALQVQSSCAKLSLADQVSFSVAIYRILANTLAFLMEAYLLCFREPSPHPSLQQATLMTQDPNR